MASYRLGFVSKPISGHHNSYIGWIVIPTITKTCVTSLRFRNLLRGKEKMYLGESGDITRPYNVLALSNSSPRVYITEGEFDAIIATGCGLPSVAMPGASSWKPEYAPLFRYRDTVVLADGDEPGLDFAKKLTQCIYECKIVSMPPGEDVSSFVFRHGKEALVRMVNS